MAHASAGSIVRPYRWLAQYYDEFYASVRTPIDLARERLLGAILKRCESGCDLACGTGDTALKMARQGILMYAVDLSERMCRIARAKAIRSGLPIRILHADMRRFTLPHVVDVITCEFDALNHVPKRSDLHLVTKAAARALKPGGYFFFDVNNALGFERYWCGTHFFEKPSAAVVMRLGHDLRRKRAWSDMEWFIREGRHWIRHHEHVEEVCWTVEEIHRALQASGFTEVREWDAAPFFKADSLIGPGCRTVYLARKMQE